MSTGIVLLCIGSMTSAQFSYHLDANSNSYSLQTPNSQAHFEQYFNGQGPQQQAQQHQQTGRYQQQAAAQTQHQVILPRIFCTAVLLN